MIKKIFFFNFFHNGDLHVSRGLVHEVAKRCSEKGIVCEYFHKYNYDVLSDNHYVKLTQANEYGVKATSPTKVIGDVLLLNTWYGGGESPIFNDSGVSFDTLYRNFQIGLNDIDIGFDQIDPIEMFPFINYSHFQIENAKIWLDGHKDRKKVFISNGNCLSGQSHNFPFSRIIKNLARQYPNIDFLISNNENGLPNISNVNVYLTQNIIRKNGVDLNENSFLASHCDFIIGRFSGTYTFAMTRQNYWDPTKTFIAFTVPTVDVDWTYKYTPKPSAKIVRYCQFQESEVMTAITDHLNLVIPGP